MSNVKVYASTEYVKAAVQEYNDIPMVFLTGTLPTTKDNVVMRFDYISKQYNKSGWCEIKCQGTSSMGYPKKNFTIKAYEDEALTQKIKFNFRGWGEQSKFCYKANWIDITHSRNVLSARLWGEVVKTRANYDSIPEELRTAPNQGAIDGFMVKVYVNGVFYGRYTLNIPKDAWMSNMDESNNNQSILVGEDCTNSGVFLAPALIDGNDWSDELHEVVPENIKTRWNEAISFINNATDEDFKNNIGNYFDIESLIDYDIFGTVICGIDSFGKNQIYFSYDNQKWYASMYDLDSTFGLMWDGSVLLPPNHARGKFQDSRRNLLYNRLEKAFGPQIAARYNELSKTVLSVPHICATFEEFISAQPFDLREEDKIFTDVDGNEHPLPLADTNTLRQIQKFVAARKSYNDQYFDKLNRGDFFDRNTTDDFGTMVLNLKQPYWSDGAEIVDTGWAPYANDDNWTLVMKIKDDVVPDGPFSCAFTSWDSLSSDPRLYLKYYTNEAGETQYQLNMGPGYGFAFVADQFFAWVGGQLSTDGHHYLILSKNGDNYDIFFDGSVMQNYGAGIGDKRSDYTVKLFATDIGNYTYYEKLQGTIEIFKVYNATTPVDQFNTIYEQMKS